MRNKGGWIEGKLMVPVSDCGDGCSFIVLFGRCLENNLFTFTLAARLYTVLIMTSSSIISSQFAM
jgi:hypothetical protein